MAQWVKSPRGRPVSHIRVLGKVLATPIAFQSPARVHPGRLQMMAQITGPCHTHGRSCGLLAPVWPSPVCHRAFEEWTSRQKILCLPLSLSHTIQIKGNKILKRTKQYKFWFLGFVLLPLPPRSEHNLKQEFHHLQAFFISELQICAYLNNGLHCFTCLFK